MICFNESAVIRSILVDSRMHRQLSTFVTVDIHQNSKKTAAGHYTSNYVIICYDFYDNHSHGVASVLCDIPVHKIGMVAYHQHLVSS